MVPGKKHCNGVRVDGANVLRKCLKKTNKKASSSFNLLQNPVGHWMVCVWWWSRSTIAGRVVVSLASKNALKLAAILETPLLIFVGLGLSERMCYLIVLHKPKSILLHTPPPESSHCYTVWRSKTNNESR